MKATNLAVYLLTAALLCPAAAVAQGQYPDHTVRVIVPFRAGGSLDIAARTVAQNLATAFGQPVVVENREGAGGNLGAATVAKSAPDGYTLLHTLNAIAVAPALYKDLPFDPGRDLAPVVSVTAQALVMAVDPALPIYSVKEFIDYANARPGQVFFGSAGVGSFDHLSGELLKYMTKVNITHTPYKDGTLAKADVMGGRVAMIFVGMADAEAVRTGKFRGLAVTSSKRVPTLPDIPTMAESGVPQLAKYEVVNSNALFAPAGTPAAVIARLNSEVNRILNLTDVRATFDKLGLQTVGGSAQELGQNMVRDIDQWKKVAEEAHIKVE